ncbi:unnamed protein product [Pleuronectes platessa]|uniref:Uncharacterized protein n=1 Tax=Pleuronectes platessa TaxID=8262 RepID=A0A9N7VVM8_PLEPL|nr:unnamed protein product [Pleuronectes platessa]
MRQFNEKGFKYFKSVDQAALETRSNIFRRDPAFSWHRRVPVAPAWRLRLVCVADRKWHGRGEERSAWGAGMGTVPYVPQSPPTAAAYNAPGSSGVWRAGISREEGGQAVQTQARSEPDELGEGTATLHRHARNRPQANAVPYGEKLFTALYNSTH